MRFFAEESCQKCTPCRIGNRALHHLCEELEHGRAPMTREKVDEWLLAMEKTSICGLGQAAPFPVRNAMHRWPELFSALDALNYALGHGPRGRQPMAARAGLVVVALLVALVSASGSASAPGEAPQLSVVWAEPGDATRVFVERVAAPYDGGKETWLLNLDVRLRLTWATSVRLQKLEWSFPGTTIPVGKKIFSLRDKTASLVGLGDTTTIQVPETRLFSYPLPRGMQLRFYVRGNETPLTVGRRLAEWTSAVREVRISSRSAARICLPTHTSRTTTRT